MKPNILLLLIISAFFSTAYKSQVTTSIQTINHPSVEDVKIVYKSVVNTYTLANAPFQKFMAVPIVTVTLKSSANTSKIYFKITDSVTDSILYSANYYLIDTIQLNNFGKRIFEKSNGSVILSSGLGAVLKPYTFKIQTEDSIQNLSPVYLKIR